MSEEWRDVPGYEGRYQVSSTGNVRSIGLGGNWKAGKTLKPMLCTPGHQYVHVALYRDGVRRHFKVHHLVMLAFVGPRPDDSEVNHIDGDGGNNRRENLEYSTRSENLKHAFRLGLMNVKGERNAAAKLSWDQVREIRRRFRTGETGRSLAIEFGMSASAVSFIVTGQTWKESA